MTKNNSFKNILSILLILIILLLGRTIFINHFFNNKETIVPSIINIPKDEAIKLLKKANLKYKIIYSKSSEVKENYVFIQFPEKQSIVKINRIVQVWVNKSEVQEIPDIVGKNLIEARRFLEELNIKIDRIDYRASSKFDEEKVLAIYPAVGNKITANQKVSLLVSSKPLINSSIMPNLIGLDKNEAINILSSINKTINLISDAKDESFPKNVIIATNPMPGETIDSNTKISVVLNTGVELDKTVTEVIKEKKEVPQDKEDKKIENILEKTLKELNEKEEKKGE